MSKTGSLFKWLLKVDRNKCAGNRIKSWNYDIEIIKKDLRTHSALFYFRFPKSFIPFHSVNKVLGQIQPDPYRKKTTINAQSINYNIWSFWQTNALSRDSRQKNANHNHYILLSSFLVFELTASNVYHITIPFLSYHRASKIFLRHICMKNSLSATVTN